MATPIQLPDLGEGIESAEVVSILVSEGDSIQAEQSLMEIETDKAAVEVPSPRAGTIAKILVSAGDTVKVGQDIVELEDSEDSPSDGDESGDEKDSGDDKKQTKSGADQKKDKDKKQGKDQSGQEPQQKDQKKSKSKSGQEGAGGGKGQSQKVPVPDLGEGIESAEVINILVSVGDSVQAEQSLVEIETDKAAVEVPCPSAGTIEEVHVSQGDTVNIGDPLVTLTAEDAGQEDQPEPEPEKDAEQDEPADQAGEQPSDESTQAKQADKSEETVQPAGQRSAPPKSTAPGVPRRPSDEPGRPDKVVPAGPAVRKLARELGVDLSDLDGTGPGGRINADDVKSAVRQRSQSAPASSGPADAPKPGKQTQQTQPPGQADQDDWGAVHVAKLSGTRKTIANRMADSMATIPHVTHFDEADVTDLDAFRKAHKSDLESRGVKLTLLPFVIRAVANALKVHPKVNARIDMDEGTVTYHDYVSINLAVDTDKGLLVPVLRNADQLGIGQIAARSIELAEQARSGKLGSKDMQGGTFTISNVGSIGGWFVTPVINKPQSAILLLGRGKQKPVVQADGQIIPRLMLPLSLSYDHRLIDGADAARFVNEVKTYLEDPGKLLLLV